MSGINDSINISYGFYNSADGDRRIYSAEQFSSIFDGLISDGVYANQGQKFKVTVNPNDANTVLIGTGRAWFNHTWILNETVQQIEYDAPDQTFDRIDAVVIGVDTGNRRNGIYVVTGTPGSPASRPTLTNNSSFHQYPIAYLTIKPGVDTPTNIEITVGTTACPLVVCPVQGAQDVSSWTSALDLALRNAQAAKEAELDTWARNLQSAVTNDDFGTTLRTDVDHVQADTSAILEYVLGINPSTNQHNDMPANRSTNNIPAQIASLIESDNSIRADIGDGEGKLGYRVTALESALKAPIFNAQGASYTIDNPPCSICYLGPFSTSTTSVKGTPPSKIGGNGYLVITRIAPIANPNASSQYNIQVAFGFGSDKIALRRKYNAAKWSAWKYLEFK